MSILKILILVVSFNAVAGFSQPVKRIKYNKSYRIASLRNPVARLPVQVRETSGLLYWRGLFWTINDSGNTNELFGIDPSTGEIRQQIRVEGGTNVDWEALTQDDSFIYIADTGNNKGNRTNLCIYRLKKTDMTLAEKGIIRAEVLHFVYDDQVDFSIRLHKNAFDCEALIATDTSLMLFSKNWRKEKTTLYQLPKTPGSYAAKSIAEFNCRGLITDATVDSSGNFILLGYQEFTPFIWLIDRNILSETKMPKALRIDFPLQWGVQTEGVCVREDGKLVVSCEQTGFKTSSLFLFSAPQRF